MVRYLKMIFLFWFDKSDGVQDYKFEKDKKGNYKRKRRSMDEKLNSYRANRL